MEDDEADILKKTGQWFATPGEASLYRKKLEDEINRASMANDTLTVTKSKRRGKKS
jgi:hypothetical protein